MSMAERPSRPARGKLTPPANADLDPIDARPTAPEPQPIPTVEQPERTPDEGKGAPAPAAAAEQATSSAPVTAPPAKSVVVQSGVNWSLETERIVSETKARTNKTRRAIVEEAIAHLWGS